MHITRIPVSALVAGALLAGGAATAAQAAVGSAQAAKTTTARPNGLFISGTREGQPAYESAIVYRIVGQPVVLRGVISTPSGNADGNVLIFRVSHALPEGSNHAIKAVAQIGKVSSFTPPSDPASGWGMIHASRHGVACYSEDLGHETRLLGEKSGHVTFYVTAKGRSTPIVGHAKIAVTKTLSDLSVPITSKAAKKLGC
jgi:hypothetical protein